jgi:hypothetical protein
VAFFFAHLPLIAPRHPQGQSKTITNSQLTLPLQIPAANLISRRNSPTSQLESIMFFAVILTQ